MKLFVQNGNATHPYPFADGIKETAVPEFSRQQVPLSRPGSLSQDMRVLIRSYCENKENIPNQGLSGLPTRPVCPEAKAGRQSMNRNAPSQKRTGLSICSTQDTLNKTMQSMRPASFLKLPTNPPSRTSLSRKPVATPSHSSSLAPTCQPAPHPPTPLPTSGLGPLQQYIPSILSHYKSTASKNKSLPKMASAETRQHSNLKIKIFETIFNFCTYFSLRPRTFFTTNNIYDRYTAFLDLTQNRGQENPTLVALASFFIAAKFEEIYPPQINEVCRVLNNRFTPHMVFEMESRILSVLDFNFVYVCPLDAMELIATQWDANVPEVLNTGTVLLSLFCFENCIDGHNVFKLAVFALSVAQRVVREMCLPRAENVVSSEECHGFLRSLKSIFDSLEQNSVGCFEARHKDRLAKLRGFVFDKA